MCRVMRAFVCGGCVNQVTGTGRTGVDVGDIAGLELVAGFRHPGTYPKKPTGFFWVHPPKKTHPKKTHTSTLT